MHDIVYEHMVGVPRESKQHLDAVCMCGRLERVVQPAFRLVTRRSAGALRECVTAMVARSMVGRPARDTAAHSSAAPTVGAGATGWQLLSGSAVEGWAILVTGLLQLALRRNKWHFGLDYQSQSYTGYCTQARSESSRPYPFLNASPS